jgi:segregation and condensation protein A
MYESSYNVKTHIYEGPLDTLLSLIEKRKLFISDISLAQVADDYIAYINTLSDFPIADSAHFILIASTLVLIKSKSLLPNLSLTEEEQHSIEDLEVRLKEYQKYRELSIELKKMFGCNMQYERLPTKTKVVAFNPDAQVTIQSIRETIRQVIAHIPKKEFIPKAIVDKVISLEDMIQNLTERITTSMKMSFSDFSGMKGAIPEEKKREMKVTVIVSFLAMLELVKQGIIHVTQDKEFQDINMETHTVGIPQY